MDLLKKVLTKKDKGGIQYGIFAILFMVLFIVLVVANLYYRKVESIKVSADNAIVLSVLSADLIDSEAYADYDYLVLASNSSYGTVTNNKAMFDTASQSAYLKTYNIFSDSLKENLNLDDNLVPVKNNDVKQLRINKYVLYNVVNDVVYEVAKPSDNDLPIITALGPVGSVRTPNGQLIEHSGIYANVYVDIYNFLKKQGATMSLHSYVDIKYVI